MTQQPSIPFVVCQSMGGPYDDESFVAGFALGVLSISLSNPMMSPEFVMPVYTKSITQADLIAMRHGWTTKPIDSMGEWTILKFKRGINVFEEAEHDCVTGE